MKKLSIEEKAKAYDEAIEIAKEINNEQRAQPFNVMIRVFPELKESEDERIRKVLLEMVHDTTGDSLWVDYNVHKEDAIDWLEKQGEQKLYVNDNAKEMFIKALERVEEQNNKGYKLTDCDKNSWWEDFKAYTSCTIEQKPAAWSDEDEKQARQIERIVHDDGCTQKLQKQIADWFKSLKERCNWKPSDEQIRRLEYFVKSWGKTEDTENTKVFETVKSLLNDLKQLKQL